MQYLSNKLHKITMEFKNKHKTLLILDLDETLVYATEQKLDREADFLAFDYFVYKRPYLDAFLNELQKHYLLAVWSSASDDYVAEVVKNIVPKEIKLEFVWGRSRSVRKLDIDVDNAYAGDYWNHSFYIKPLKKVRRRGYNLDRVLIVDDTPHKCQRNYGNAIYPQEYQGNLEDSELKYLIQYLKTLKDKTNVRHIEKRGWRNSMK